MEQQASFEDLRALLTLAKQLRASAAQTSDISYSGLFLKTASALEARADRLAFPVHARIGHGMRAGARRN